MKVLVMLLAMILNWGFACLPASADGKPNDTAPVSTWTIGQFESFIRGADKLELIFNRGYPNDHVDTTVPVGMAVLDNPADIRALVSKIQLVAKEPCQCDHSRMIVFGKGHHRLEASICDHCLDLLVGGKFAMGCKMPEPVYREFKRQEDEYLKSRVSISKP